MSTKLYTGKITDVIFNRCTNKIIYTDKITDVIFGKSYVWNICRDEYNITIWFVIYLCLEFINLAMGSRWVYLVFTISTGIQNKLHKYILPRIG